MSARASKTSGPRETFRRWSEHTASAIGTPVAFFVALAVIVGWAAAGPLFGFSDTWQFVINTGTTIITFLIVFLIQNTQNRDTRIFNLKLDELLRAVEGARTDFSGLNHLSERQLDELSSEFSRLAERYGALVHDDLAQVRQGLAERQSKAE